MPKKGVFVRFRSTVFPIDGAKSTRSLAALSAMEERGVFAEELIKPNELIAEVPCFGQQKAANSGERCVCVCVFLLAVVAFRSS